MSDTPQGVLNWIENAVSDMGFEQVKMWEETGFDDSDNNMLTKAKKDGVGDIVGWYTDCLYDDATLLADLLGDRVCDICGFDTPERVKFVAELRLLRSDASWQTACTKIDS